MNQNLSRRIALCWLFMLSGVCGLIYESIWPHYLKLFLGHAAYSQTLVLVVFIGGMALGAALCGRFAARIRRPLLAYAAVEFLIGILALVFHGVYVSATGWAYDVLLPHTCGENVFCVSQWFLSALLILPQSILLGMTFPLMAAGILRVSQGETGRALGFLYAQNTLGGVLGVLLSVFVLVPNFGLPGTLLTVGLGNILLAIVVYGLSKGETLVSCPTATLAVDTSQQVSGKMMWVLAALTGLSSFFYEVLWIRMLNLVLGSSTHAFELMLASFLLGMAIGGYWIRSRIDTLRRPVVTLACIQLAMGVLAIFTLPIYDRSFAIMAALLKALAHTENGYLLFNLGSAGLALVVMLPATIAAGMTLPLITNLLLRSGRGETAIGRVYAANTLGAILGVVLVVQVMIPLAGIKNSLVFAGAIDVALGLWILGFYRKAVVFGKALPAGAAFAAVVVLVAPFVFSLDNYKTASGVFRKGQPTVLNATIPFHRDGKTSTVDVINAEGVLSIRTNGKTDASARVDTTRVKRVTPDTSTMVMAGLAGPLHHPAAKTAAVIGFGSGISTASILSVPSIERVDTIEIESAMVEGARLFQPLNSRAYTDPRSHIVIDDAKAYLARGQRRYDIIVSEPSNPWVSGVATLFSREFYERMRHHLNPGGLLVQWVQVYEINDTLLASVEKSLGAVFSDYVIYEISQGDLMFVASPEGKVPDLDAALMKDPSVHAQLAYSGVESIGEWRMRRMGGKQLLGLYFDSFPTPENSDFFPILDEGAAQARFMQSLASGVFHLPVLPVPIGEWMGEPAVRESPSPDLARFPMPAKSEYVHASRATALAFERFAGGQGKVEASALGTEQRWLLLRLTMDHCPLDETELGRFLGAISEISGEINVALTPEERSRLWPLIKNNACLKRYTAQTQGFVALFEAVARRDSVAMARQAHELRSAAVHYDSASLTEYLALAEIMGAIATKNTEQAKEAFSLYAPRFRENSQPYSAFRVFSRLLGFPPKA